jgi:membrane protein
VSTSLLFTLGKSAMGWYFGYSLLNSPYGAAAPLVIFMVWISPAWKRSSFGSAFTSCVSAL